MPLNKQKGNMYPWVTHTWNVIKGKCPHDCSYCYMKGYPQPELHFDEKEMSTNLGEGGFIFVGSSCDMWASSIPNKWITSIVNHCMAYKSRFLFQSKNPSRFAGLTFPGDVIFGTTIESNRDYRTSKAPYPWERYMAMTYLGDYRRMVSIEPIMDFDLEILVIWIKDIKPEFVSIGADSKGHKLIEPPPGKVLQLFEELRGITDVKVKDNLKRILRQEMPSW